ncbi:Leucine-rich repeat domain, L domain-like [Phytophthora cactorum]|nr:Leucine-rich repeat domain, L domain-like [Phytophthora cactorum]
MGNPRKQSSCVYPKRHRLAAASLVVFALFLIVYVEESTRTSAIACRPHPECIINARRWIILEKSSLTQCPCLALIDNDFAPKTHVEGKATIGLVSLPVDMFDEMSSLTTLHLGSNVALPRLPSFHGLTNLKVLALAVSMALEELPAFDSLHKLERLVIAIAPLLDSLPTFPPSMISSLLSLWTEELGVNPMCGTHPVWGTPAATCLPTNRTEKVASRATLDAITKFSKSVCGGIIRPTTVNLLQRGNDASCGGILYRHCEIPGIPEAICYNARFMGIACTASKFPIEMRRRQIALGVGDPCNPEYEAWLGCK